MQADILVRTLGFLNVRRNMLRMSVWLIVILTKALTMQVAIWMKMSLTSVLKVTWLATVMALLCVMGQTLEFLAVLLKLLWNVLVLGA